MKLLTYQSNNRLEIGVVDGEEVLPMTQVVDMPPQCLNEMLSQLPEWEQRIGDKLSDDSATRLAIDTLDLRPCVPHPEKIICIGLNYADHAKETGSAIPPEPLVFNKFYTALRSHGDAIELPSESDSVDFEAELVVVIGKEGRRIALEDSMEYVAGYTCGHDVSARDWQKGKPGGQWLCGKSFDSFAPIGPHFTSVDEVPDPHDLRIQFRLNGQTMQDSTTAQLIFNIPQLIAYLSQVCTLRPGDLIFTGTPPGVGVARKPPVFLKPGDIAEVEIEGLGVLRNPVVGG